MNESQAEKLKKHRLKIELAKREARIQKIRQTQGGEDKKMKISLARMSWDKNDDN